MRKLTIVVPCYERSEYLKESLSSIISAIEFSGENVALFVLDNHSKNKMVKEVCNNLGVKYHRNDNTIPLFSNWNKAIELADTEFVSIIGDDDIVTKEYISSFFLTIKAHSDIDFYYTNIKFIDEVGLELCREQSSPYGLNTKSQLINHAIENGFGIPTVSIIYKRETFMRSGGFDATNIGSNDWVYIYNMMTWGKCYGNEIKLVHYRKHNKGASDELKFICKLSQLYLYEQLTEKKSVYWLRLFLYSSMYRSEIDLKNKYTMYLDSYEGMWGWFHKAGLANILLKVYRLIKGFK